MKLLITGASGFLGKYVVAEALRQGHQVKAVVRPASDSARLPWHAHPSVELVRLDLRQRGGVVDALKDVDCVLHLAAVKGGDFYDRFAGTVLTTENLLNAMETVGLHKLVAISTFSVYDYLHPRMGKVLDEQFPMELNPDDRDAYAQTKLIQEDMVREFEAKHQGEVTIIRPGMIYGRESLWNACHGTDFGATWIVIGPKALIPLTYVENCAEAIILAVNTPQAVGQTINVVDDDLPTREQYTKALTKCPDAPKRIIPMPWPVMRSIASLAWFVNKQLLGGNARLPGLLIPASLDARLKPFQYSNELAKSVLNWQPRYSLEEALQRSCGDQNIQRDLVTETSFPMLEESVS